MNTSYAKYATSICKTLKSLGVVQESLYIPILNEALRLLSSSGPEFLLSRLSSLTEWRKQHVAGNTSYYEPWFKNKQVYDRKTDSMITIPADKFGSTVWRFKDKSFFAVVGALRKCITFDDPTYKQLWKWLSGVRSQYKPHESEGVVWSREKKVSKYLFLNDRLIHHMKEIGPFLPGHITGLSIPIGMKNVPILSKDKRTKDPAKLMHAYFGSIQSAPLTALQYYTSIQRHFVDGKLECIESFVISQDEINSSSSEVPYRTILEDEFDMATMPFSSFRGKYWKGLSPTTKVGRRLCTMLGNTALTDNTVLPECCNAPTNMGSFYDFNRLRDTMDIACTRRYYNTRDLLIYGSVSFIQEKAGKLRTVANPNRFVQYLLTPLGKTLDEWQRSFTGCFVYDQEAGKARAQELLRSGSTIAAFDLTSATDHLDYRGFLRDTLGVLADKSPNMDFSYLKERYNSVDYDYIKEHPYLDAALSLFIHASSSPWKLPSEFSRKTLGAHTDFIQWKVGQPLGLRPSFPLLTIMNCQFAESACMLYWNKFISKLKDDGLWPSVVKSINNTLVDEPYPSDPDQQAMIRYSLFCDTGRWFDDAEGKFLSFFLRREWRKDIPKKDIFRYVCVGDDMVIDHRFSDYYVDLVKRYNGRISEEKGMISNKAIEFCSTIITKEDMYPLKPSFLEGVDGSIQNLERFTSGQLNPKVPRWVSKLHNNAARMGIPGLTRYGVSKPNQGGPRPLTERLFGYFLTEVSQKPRRDEDIVSFQTLYQRSLLNPKLASWWSESRDYRYSSRNFLDWEIEEYDPDLVVLQKGTPSAADLHFLSQFDIDLSFPLSWDYRTGSYTHSESIVSVCRSLEKLGSRIEWLSSKDDETALLRATKGDSTFTFLVPNDPNHILSGKAIEDMIMTVEGAGTKAITLDPSLYTGQYSYWTGGNAQRTAAEQAEDLLSSKRAQALSSPVKRNMSDDFTR